MTRLSLLAAALGLVAFPVLPAQSHQDQPTSPAAARGELEYRLGDTTVRRWIANGAKAAWCRDGGATWQGLLDPDDRLHFVLQSFDPLADAPSFDGALAAPAGTRLFLVQFQTQILGPYRVAVEQAGAEILHYLPANALCVRCDATTTEALRALACVRWVGPLANAFKLDGTLRAFVLAGGPQPIDCNLVLAQKGDRERVSAQIAGLGGQLLDPCTGSVMVRARLSPRQLQALLAFDTVTWADELGLDGEDMDNARIVGGANMVEALGGYRGQGVRAEITESLDETHQDLVGRVQVRGSNGVASHGHCTACIVGGSGAGNASARGMMPECNLVEGAYSSGNHYAQIQGSVNPALAWRTMVATASWGSSLTTAYTSISQAMDDALFASDLTRLNSQSNSGSQLSRPEAWAKNIISVGGLRHYNDANPANDAWAGGASIGPAADGRLKPDIHSFYDSVLTGDRPGTAGYTNTDYYTGFNGTSSATPIVAGHVGILQQMFTDGLFGNPLPLPATMGNRFANKPHMTTSKALLCNTATQQPFVGTADDRTRTHQGWGYPNLDRLYANRDRIVVLDEYDTLQLGQTRTYWVQILPGTPEFRATMVYADPAAQASASIQLVNDANLKVTRVADGVFWWGNHGLEAGTASTSGGVPNDRDTIECVYLSNPVPGAYAVTVTAASIVQDGKLETPQLDLDYALVMHPTGGYRDTSGMVLDLSSTGPGDLTLQCSNVPASGWTEGYTAISFTTNRGLGFGGFFGLEIDGITGALWTSPSAAGSPLHFPNTAPSTSSYPFAAFQFDPGLISFLAGFQVDMCVVLWNGPDIVAVSNVDRIVLQ